MYIKVVINSTLAGHTVRTPRGFATLKNLLLKKRKSETELTASALKKPHQNNRTNRVLFRPSKKRSFNLLSVLDLCLSHAVANPHPSVCLMKDTVVLYGKVNQRVKDTHTHTHKSDQQLVLTLQCFVDTFNNKGLKMCKFAWTPYAYYGTHNDFCLMLRACGYEYGS